MFVGVPGSGKTTFARQLARKINGVTINSDAMRLSMWGSKEAVQRTHSSPRERANGNRLTFGAMDYAAAQILKAGHSVIYDANANNYAERNKMAHIAVENGGVGIVVRINTPHDVAIRRGLEREEAADQPRFVAEKAEDVVKRFAQAIEEPDEREQVVIISGEDSFERQYQDFCEQIEQK